MMTELDKINTIGVWLGSDTRQARSAVDFMNGLLDEIQKLQSELEKVKHQLLEETTLSEHLKNEHDFGKYLIDSLPGSLVREYRRDFERQKKVKNET